MKLAKVTVLIVLIAEVLVLILDSTSVRLPRAKLPSISASAVTASAVPDDLESQFLPISITDFIGDEDLQILLLMKVDYRLFGGQNRNLAQKILLALIL